MPSRSVVLEIKYNGIHQITIMENFVKSIGHSLIKSIPFVLLYQKLSNRKKYLGQDKISICLF